MNLQIFTDGGSRGNPGTAGYGVVVYDDQKTPIYQESRYLGIKTNNEAEYYGLLAALSWLHTNHQNYTPQLVTFNLDSQLVVRQINGLYKVKNANLIPLYQQAKNLIQSFPFRVEFQDIRREYNSQADHLANQAMDQARS
jgi:ribonuclease HI